MPRLLGALRIEDAAALPPRGLPLPSATTLVASCGGGGAAAAAAAAAAEAPPRAAAARAASWEAWAVAGLGGRGGRLGASCPSWRRAYAARRRLAAAAGSARGDALLRRRLGVRLGARRRARPRSSRERNRLARPSRCPPSPAPSRRGRGGARPLGGRAARALLARVERLAAPAAEPVARRDLAERRRAAQLVARALRARRLVPLADEDVVARARVGAATHVARHAVEVLVVGRRRRAPRAGARAAAGGRGRELSPPRSRRRRSIARAGRPPRRRRARGSAAAATRPA